MAWLSIVSTYTTLIQPSPPIYMSVCGVLNHPCSSLSHHSAFLFIFLPLFIWQFGWGLIKLTRGEAEVSDCSQRRRSALFWTKQPDDNDSSCADRGGGQTFLFSSVSGLFVTAKQLSAIILFILRLTKVIAAFCKF